MEGLSGRILGGLVGAASGDAMGAATEARTTEQILSYFGHKVVDFETPPDDTFGAGNVPGQVTDDFSSAYFIAQSVTEAGGRVDETAIRKALIEWSKHAVFFDRFAGPTTRLAIRVFQGEKIESSARVDMTARQATNGAAMRISPIGLINAGDVDGAVRDAVTAAMVTHDNYLAVSGACAVSAAVSAAAGGSADLYSVLQAGLYGAKEGEKAGRKCAKDVAGPSVIKRIEMAVDIGLGPGTPDEKMREISDRIGTGLHVSEAVPAAFGFFAASGGDSMETIISAVNAGYDTDTAATMAGAIAGALNGISSFPEHFLPTLEEANHFAIRALSERIVSVVESKQERKAENE